MTDRNEIISNVVTELARKYARKSWWCDERDLIQEGWLEVLKNGPMDDIGPQDFRRYVYSVVSRRMSRFLWSQSSPASDSKPGKHLAGVQRAPLEAMPVTAAPVQELGAEPARCQALRALVRRRVEASLQESTREARRAAATSPKGVQRVRRAHLDCVLMVVLDGKEQVEAAAARGIGWREVQSGVTKFMAKARRDRELLRMLTQLRELQVGV